MTRPQRKKRYGSYRRKARKVSYGSSAHRFIGICPVTRKRQYGSEGDAKTAARAQGGGLATFQCDSCAYHHLGGRHGMDRAEHRDLHATDPTVLELALSGAL